MTWQLQFVGERCPPRCSNVAMRALRGRGVRVDPNQRKSEVRGFVFFRCSWAIPRSLNSDAKGEIERRGHPASKSQENLDFFPDDRQTPARREARNHRGEDAEMLGPPPSRSQRTGRADQRGARGDDVNRDRITQNRRRRVLLCATQRPRSTNNETTTTMRHRELRDPRLTHPTVDLRDLGASLIERR